MFIGKLLFKQKLAIQHVSHWCPNSKLGQRVPRVGWTRNHNQRCNSSYKAISCERVDRHYLKLWCYIQCMGETKWKPSKYFSLSMKGKLNFATLLFIQLIAIAIHFKATWKCMWYILRLECFHTFIVTEYWCLAVYHWYTSPTLTPP